MHNTFIGKSVNRTEASTKIRGKAKYTDDLTFPDMLHGITIRSTTPRGTLKSITYADNFPWKEFTIVDYHDIPKSNHIAHILNDQPCLVEKKINHLHEPILLLAHKDKLMLEKAKKNITLNITSSKPILSIKDSLKKKPVIWGTDNALKSILIDKGDVDKAFGDAEIVIKGEYTTGAQEHLYIENNAIVAKANLNDGVTVWGGMQCPYFVQHALGDVFDFPDEKLRVIQVETGGAFGGKEDFSSMISCHAALLALKSGKHVKLAYDRHEDMAATTKRHPSYSKYRTAVDKDGKLMAMDIEFLLDGGAYSTMSPVVLSRGAIHAGGPYNCPNVRIKSIASATNSPPYGAFRGFGAPQSFFALEKHIDDIAKAINKTPEEFRRLNFIKDGDFTATEQKINDLVDLQKLLDQALQISDYHQKLKLFKKENSKNHIKKGIGFSSFMHGSGFTGSGEKRMASIAAIEGTNGGRVNVLVSSTEMGQGRNTVLMQIAADALGVDVSTINVPYPDTTKVPNTGPTVASRTTMVVGDLVSEAAQKLKATLFEAKLLHKNYTTEDFKNAIIKYIESNGELKLFSEYKEPPNINWDEENHRGDAYTTFSWAIYVAEVEIDTVTYEAKVTDFVALQEIGKVINPTLATGQIQGGVAQGIGFALYENTVLKDGAMINNQMTNYVVPGIEDLPEIRVAFTESPYRFGQTGAKGIGELPMDGVAPAVANAIENATGKSFKNIPIMPEHIMEMINE